jgi:hypothetical protein
VRQVDLERTVKRPGAQPVLFIAPGGVLQRCEGILIEADDGTRRSGLVRRHENLGVLQDAEPSLQVRYRIHPPPVIARDVLPPTRRSRFEEVAGVRVPLRIIAYKSRPLATPRDALHEEHHVSRSLEVRAEPIRLSRVERAARARESLACCGVVATVHCGRHVADEHGPEPRYVAPRISAPDLGDENCTAMRACDPASRGQVRTARTRAQLEIQPSDSFTSSRGETRPRTVAGACAATAAPPSRAARWLPPSMASREPVRPRRPNVISRAVDPPLLRQVKPSESTAYVECCR